MSQSVISTPLSLILGPTVSLLPPLSRGAAADDALVAAGCDDGEILEVNQVCAYFNYSNRLLNGLGVTTQGDVLGYYKEPEAT